MKNSYRNRVLLPLLKNQISPAEYMRVIQPYLHRLTGSLRGIPGEDYWQMIPWYICTRCPFCQKEHQEPLDTYSLLSLRGMFPLFSKHIALVGNNFQLTVCPHLFTYHCFLNLHNELPTTPPYFSCGSGGIPFITPWLLPENVESYAILHALPICQIESDQFVPSYTLFILAYFSNDPAQVKNQHFDAERKRGEGDDEFYAIQLGYPIIKPTTEKFYNLSYWASSGLLGYLDFMQKDLPIRIGKGLELPTIYKEIEGHRGAYRWRENGPIKYSNH